MKNAAIQNPAIKSFTVQMNTSLSFLPIFVFVLSLMMTSCGKEAMEDLQPEAVLSQTESLSDTPLNEVADYTDLSPEEAAQASARIQELIQNSPTPAIESVPFQETDGSTATARSPLQVISTFYTISSKINGYNADVRGGKLNNNNPIWNHSSNKTAAQFWSFHSTSGGYYYIKSKLSGKYLTVKHASKASKASIVQHTYHSSLADAQKWRLVPSGIGDYYYLVNKKSGKLLDVKFGSNKNGTLLWQFDFNGSNAQLFRIRPANFEKPRYSKTYGGNGGSAFKLLPPGGLIKAKKISRIFIRHGKFVDAVQVEWEMVNGEKVWSKRAGGSGGRGTMITLKDTEYITKVTGRSGKYVDQLTFHTSHGRKFGPNGGSGGASFTIQGPPDGIKGLQGRSGKFLDKIGGIF